MKLLVAMEVDDESAAGAAAKLLGHGSRDLFARGSGRWKGLSDGVGLEKVRGLTGLLMLVH